MTCGRSYVFRFSAPTAVTMGAAVPSADSTPTPNGAAQREQSATGDRERETNGVAETAPSPARMMPPKPSPSLGAPTKQSSKADIGKDGESCSEAKVTGSKAQRKVPSSNVETEREAMLKANLPSTFGAMRDKPLGKKAVREAHIVRGVAGVAIAATDDRFATGPRTSRNKSPLSSGSPAEEEIVDKAEARRRKESEIAAITAELSRRDPDGADGEGEDEHEKEFIPGGWRHASSSRGSVLERPKKDVKNNSKIRSVLDDRKEGRNSYGDREQEEEEPMEEEEDEEEETLTNEMRVKLVVRRLGLPVSHEVQLSGHRKGVMALALDRAGGRVATGSNDYKVCLSILLHSSLVDS